MAALSHSERAAHPGRPSATARGMPSPRPSRRKADRAARRRRIHARVDAVVTALSWLHDGGLKVQKRAAPPPDRRKAAEWLASGRAPDGAGWRAEYGEGPAVHGPHGGRQPVEGRDRPPVSGPIRAEFEANPVTNNPANSTTTWRVAQREASRFDREVGRRTAASGDTKLNHKSQSTHASRAGPPAGTSEHGVGAGTEEMSEWHEALQSAHVALAPLPYAVRHQPPERIRARDVALPDSPGRVRLLDVLPPPIAARYATRSDKLMLTQAEILQRDAAEKKQKKRHIKPVMGATTPEYLALLRRMVERQMLSFTESPMAVNGVFAVAKGDKDQRLIIDARPANRAFRVCPEVHLPTPDLTARLEPDEDGGPLFAAKVDLANYYHQLVMPTWMHPYFALPAVQAGAVGVEHLFGGQKEVWVWPCCTTLPMGFSHAVYLAQAVHEHVLCTRCGFNAADAVGPNTDTRLDRVRWQAYIDDLLLFGHDQKAVAKAQERYVAEMRRLGFPIKQEKVVRPTCKQITVLGLEFRGTERRLGLAASKLEDLIQRTQLVLHRGSCSGSELSQLVGSWVWASLARRPALAAFAAVYRFIEATKGRRVPLWASAQRELRIVCGIAPLLYARLGARACGAVLASDASLGGMGVVVRAASQEQQRVLAADAGGILRQIQRREIGVEAAEEKARDAIGNALSDRRRDPQRSRPATVQWFVAQAYRWKRAEHINVLEARAACCAIRYLARQESCSGRCRALLLCDSAVVVGAMQKGRTSAFRLLVQLRRMSAVLLGSDLELNSVWIPSKCNPADAPSRAGTAGAQEDEQE
jgi:hypothetical protein